MELLTITVWSFLS